ncbi:MAG TPA: hypothetical protein VF690_11180, partial [Hymenobacter sp.]
MSTFLRFLLLLVLLGAARPGSAQQPAPAPAPGTTGAAFNVEAATQTYLNSLTPAQKAKSDAYFEGGYWLQLWGLLYGLAVAGVFLGLGLSRRLKALVARLPRPGLRTLAYVALYLLLAWALSLPLTVYEGYFREHQYGLSNQTLGEWFGDALKSLALSVVFGSLLILLLYAAVRRAGRRWWVWGTGIMAIFLVLGVFVSPVFISPLFNKYTPL